MAARPDKALARRLFATLLKRKRTLDVTLVWIHTGDESRAAVKLDELNVLPRVSLITRGDPAALETIRLAVERALKPHPELDDIERYRESEEAGVVDLDAYGEPLAGPQPLSEDRRYISADVLQGRVLYELVCAFEPPLCLELGTAYGVSALYLLAGAPATRLVTVEADGVRRDAALRAFGRFDVASRVRSELGLFDDVLPSLLTELNTLSFVFEDGPHIPEVTLGVFNAVIDRMASGGLLVFDDIHHRKTGNERAWAQIVTHPEITASAEVNGRQGICVKR